MKHSRIIGIISLIIITLLTFVIYILISIINDCECCKIRKRLQLSDNIQWMYYLGDIKIDNPIITCVDDKFYVFEYETINKYDGCDSLFVNRDDVVWLYRVRNHREKRCINTKEKFAYDDIDKYLECVDSLNNLPLYRFYYKPQNFLLIMVRQYDYNYQNNNYIPSVIPRFTHHQEHKMEKMAEERLLIEFQNMKNPPINLFVDSPK